MIHTFQRPFDLPIWTLLRVYFCVCVCCTYAYIVRALCILVSICVCVLYIYIVRALCILISVCVWANAVHILCVRVVCVYMCMCERVYFCVCVRTDIYIVRALCILISVCVRTVHTHIYILCARCIRMYYAYVRAVCILDRYSSSVYIYIVRVHCTHWFLSVCACCTYILCVRAICVYNIRVNSSSYVYVLACIFLCLCECCTLYCARCTYWFLFVCECVLYIHIVCDRCMRMRILCVNVSVHFKAYRLVVNCEPLLNPWSFRWRSTNNSAVCCIKMSNAYRTNGKGRSTPHRTRERERWTWRHMWKRVTFSPGTCAMLLVCLILLIFFWLI